MDGLQAKEQFVLNRQFLIDPAGFDKWLILAAHLELFTPIDRPRVLYFVTLQFPRLSFPPQEEKEGSSLPLSLSPSTFSSRFDPTPPVKTTCQIPLTGKRKSRNRNLHRKEREALLPQSFFLLDFDASRNPNSYLEFDESIDHMARIEDLREKSIYSFCFLRLSFI
ncbi:hypothetical protein AAC387_Pa09g2167 [Persea americana]